MASSFNIKCVHRDGKTELKIGMDESAKIIDADKEIIQFKNADGTDAKIDKKNIIGMPDDVSEDNKLITQKDLKNMAKNLMDIMESTKELAAVLGLDITSDKIDGEE